MYRKLCRAVLNADHGSIATSTKGVKVVDEYGVEHPDVLKEKPPPSFPNQDIEIDLDIPSSSKHKKQKRR